MGIKDRKNLRVVDGYKGSIKRKIEYYKEKLQEKRKKILKKDSEISEDSKGVRKKRVIVVAVAFIAVIIFMVVNFTTYTSARVTDTYSIAGAGDSSYSEFANGVLKYSKDGISYLNMEGEEQWNFPYQIKTPFVEVNDVSAAVACKGGNDIMIFQEEGLIGEIETTLPIEKLTISEQGIVCVILKNEESPRIICYDLAGNILVEHNISLSGMGYPMDIAISPDGEVLQVSYMYVYEGKLLSKVAYYNFGKSGEDVKDHQIAYKEYENTVIPTGFYMDDNVSAVIGDNCMTIFKGKNQIEETATIVFDKEIHSVGHSNKYIAVVLANSGETGYELRMYNKAGKQVVSEVFSENYRHLKVFGNQVIMYDGKTCAIFTKNGVMKFNGEMPGNIMEIIPASGANKYVVMNANGMEYVRLVK